VIVSVLSLFFVKSISSSYGFIARDTELPLAPYEHRFTKISTSICIPATSKDYVKGWLQEALKSIKSQSVWPTEVVVSLSGCSHTEAEKIKRSLQRALFPIELILSHVEPIQNQAKSRNIAVASSTGELISFLDADDMVHPSRTQIIESAFSLDDQLVILLHAYTIDNEDVNWVHTSWTGLGPFIPTPQVCADEVETRPVKVNLGLYVHHAHSTVRRSVLNFHRFDEASDAYRSEDSLFVREILQDVCSTNAKHALVLLAPLTRYRTIK